MSTHEEWYNALPKDVKREVDERNAALREEMIAENKKENERFCQECRKIKMFQKKCFDAWKRGVNVSIYMLISHADPSLRERILKTINKTSIEQVFLLAAWGVAYRLADEPDYKKLANELQKVVGKKTHDELDDLASSSGVSIDMGGQSS